MLLKKHISILTYRYYHFSLDHQRLLLYILASASPQKRNTLTSLHLLLN